MSESSDRHPVRRVLGAPARRVLDHRIEWLIAALDERLGRARDGSTVHERLDRVDRLLDRGDVVGGAEGLAAEAGLWFNEPVPLAYRDGGVEVLHVTERIIEQPFVFGALARRDGPQRIADVGGAESTVALSLASLGHRVTLVDPRGYRLEHPNLEVAACRLDELPDGEFDVAVVLSAVEHFGLGHYVEAVDDRRLDLEALADLRGRVVPGGLLVLTVPIGPPRVDDFERVYDAAGLDELLDGWSVTGRAVGRRRDRLTWEVVSWDAWAAAPPQDAVALVTAGPGGEPEVPPAS